MNSITTVHGINKNGDIKIIYRLLLVFTLGFLVNSCGPSAGYFKLIGDSKELETINAEKSLPNGDSIQIVEYTLDKSAMVENVDYDESLEILLIKYTQNEEGYMKQYDLSKNKTTWDANSNMSISILQNNNLILSDPKGEKLYDAQKGEFIRETEKYLYLLSDGRTLQLSPEVFAGLDVRTGKKYWEGTGAEWKGYREQYLDEEWCFVVAEGLHAIKIDDGRKWEYTTPTSYTNVGKEVAKQVALSCLAALAGGYSTSAYKPDITMNMNSEPLILDNEIYFAALDKIVCLDKASGKLIWESQIDPELEGMKLYNISETEIALLGTGTKILNFGMEKSNPPTIRIFKKKDGKVIALYALDKEAIAQSFSSTEEELFLLIPTELMIFNRDLKLIGVVETKKEYRNFLKIISHC